MRQSIRGGQRVLATGEWEPRQVVDIALDNLSVSCAHMAIAQRERGDFTQAAAHLDRAVEGLRQAGRQDFLPRGLLARAALRRITEQPRKAEQDLTKRWRSRSGLRRACTRRTATWNVRGCT